MQVCHDGLMESEVRHGKSENVWFCCDRPECRHSFSLLEFLAPEKVWLKRKAFRLQVKAFWLFSHQYSTEDAAELLGIDYGHSILALHGQYLRLVPDHQTAANADMIIGGNRLHVEADEMAFRCRPALVNNEERIEWIRYIAVARRGSAKIFMELLDQRFTGGAGQGGGEALSVEEFLRIFRVDSDSPLMAKFSILHTDSAKAYKHAGPMYWPKPSANGFYDPDVVEVHQWSFRQLQYGWTHTSVCHKKKVGQPVQYAVTRTTRLMMAVVRPANAGHKPLMGSGRHFGSMLVAVA